MASASAGLLDRLRLDVPVVQAAMAGGLSNAELAAAVARAGGLGSIGMRSPRAMIEHIARARALAPNRPIAAGLLMPFARGAHFEALIGARPEAVILMAGFAPAGVQRLRAAGIYVLHQVGSRAEAERALRDGADALIAQGVEAGGHVLGEERGSALLPQVLELAQGKPVLLAGGIADAADVASAIDAGAAAVVAGSRYLLTHEASAHPAYKQRVLGAPRTLLTQLFGVGWPLKHRVVPNAATDRWCDAQGRIPSWVAVAQRGAEPLVQRFGMLHDLVFSHGSNALPLFTPESLREGQDPAGVETTALYAGESVARIHRIASAFDVTRELAAVPAASLDART
jgi:NAD(P)H-dependent flavin oxidoreductase YrpB (nitropropane dioxygenase family)